MQIVDRDTGSAIAFVTKQFPDLPYYFLAVPEGFKRPSVFFPEPEIDSYSDTMDSFGFTYILRIHFFGSNAREGQQNAKAVLLAMARQRFSIPILEQDGEQTTEALDIAQPGNIRQTDDKPGAAILTITWDHREPYPEPESILMKDLTIGVRVKKNDEYDLDTLIAKARSR